MLSLRRSFALPSAVIAAALFFAPISAVFAARFNPGAYTQHTALCNAIKRAPQETVVEIALRYVDVHPTAKSTLLMVHGWPSLWSSWSNQIQEFENDYRLIVPNLRGFGASTHPEDVHSSGNMGDYVSDLVCILQRANVHSAICMGHDWGTQICYEAARMRPDIFTAVVGASIPYLPNAGPFVPIESLLPVFPKLGYQLYFDNQTNAAAAELNRDIRRSIRATLRTVDSSPPDGFLESTTSFLSAWSGVTEIPPVPFFTPQEEDYFVQQYSIQKFLDTLQFYMHENRQASWALAQAQGNFSVPQPALAIYPDNDPVADWVLAASVLKTADFVPNLTTEVLDGAHWVHLENPIKFNAVVRQWLEGLDKGAAGDSRVGDEL